MGVVERKMSVGVSGRTVREGERVHHCHPVCAGACWDGGGTSFRTLPRDLIPREVPPVCDNGLLARLREPAHIGRRRGES